MMNLRVLVLLLVFLMIFSSFSSASQNEDRNSEDSDAADSGVSVVQIIHKSRVSVASGDLKTALEYAIEAVSVDPAYSEAWKQCGRVLMLKGDYDEAISFFRTTLELKPEDTEVQSWLLHSLIASDRTKEMMSYLEDRQRSSGVFPDNKTVADLLSKFLEGSDTENAQRLVLLWEKKAKGPDKRQTADALKKLIEGDLDEVETILARSDIRTKAYDPLHAMAWSRLGIEYLNRNEPAKAINALLKSLEIQPGRIPALRELGWAYKRSGQPAKAAEIWDSGLRKEPRLSGWLLWIVDAHIEAGQMERASDTLDRLLRIEPANRRAQSLKLMVLLLFKDKGPADLYEKKLSRQKKGADIILMGHILADRQAGKYEDAAARLEKLYLAKPQDNEIKELLSDTYMLWASNTTAKDSLVPLQKLTELQPDNAGAWRDLGWSLWTNNENEEAMIAWEKALSHGIKNRERLEKQVIAKLAEDKQTAKAIELYRRWEPDRSLLSLGMALFNDSRYIAAAEILSEVWKSGEDRQVAGLYLAYSEAWIGSCNSVPEHINAYAEHNIVREDQPELKLILKTIEKCIDEKNMIPLINSFAEQVKASSEYYAYLTDIIEKAAAVRQSKYDHQDAYDLYIKVLRRDPNRPLVWLNGRRVAETLNYQEEYNEILSEVLASTSSTAVREGIKGWLAADKGETDKAIKHYRSSLDADPNQPELRLALFNLLMKNGRYHEAQNETEWFSKRLSEGDLTVRSYLAEMLSFLQRTDEALIIWQELHLTYPETPYYALETARVLFSLCRAQEAISILEELVAIKPDIRAYQMLADMEDSLGNTESAFKWTETALSLEPSLGIHKIRAYTAHSLGKFDIAQRSAESVLKTDAGHVSTTRIAGKAMISQGLLTDARNFYEDLLIRNPEFLPALIQLRGLSYDQENPEGALKYSKQVLDQREWDTNAGIRYAMSLAEREEFRPALKFLRDQVEKDVTQAVPILVYSNVTRCDYKGKNTSEQVIAHMERLKAEGYSFITPEELSTINEKKRIVLVIVDPDPSVLPVLDSAILRLESRAILATHTGSSSGQFPGDPSPELLKELHAGGHWVIASSGPADFQRQIVNSAGTLGNPLTHKLFVNGKSEDDTSHSDRLNALFDEASQVSSSQSRIFIYPKGDYGQLSLDTDPQTTGNLRGAVKKHFDFAIAADEGGYIVSSMDALRLPGRFVPAAWRADELITRLREMNPLIRSHLELAKALYWQGQYEKADERFRQAKDLGADPTEVNFYWGISAYQEGDLPGALERLRLARDLDPGSKRIDLALQRAEKKKRLLLDLKAKGWDDKDGRNYRQSGGSIEGYVSDHLQIELFADKDRWARDGLGKEKGSRMGAGVLWHFADEHWLAGKIWHMNLDDPGDHFGGHINVHIPVASISGNIELEAAREEIDTVEAVRDEILADRYQLNVYSRIKDEWDLNTGLSFTHRSDSNETFMLDASFAKRIHEWPFLTAGYALRLANSDTDPDEYWAPKGLQRHQLYVITRGEYKDLRYYGNLKAGYANGSSTPWRLVWGTRIILDYTIFSNIVLTAEASYMESTEYNRTAMLLGIKYRF